MAVNDPVQPQPQQGQPGYYYYQPQNNSNQSGYGFHNAVRQHPLPSNHQMQGIQVSSQLSWL